MIDANEVWKAFLSKETHAGQKWDEDVLRSMLNAALKVALSDASEDEIEWADGATGDYTKMPGVIISRRRSLLVKDLIRPHVKSMIHSMMGYTLTPAEADAVLSELMMVTHGWTPLKDRQ